jgi:organic radical activating enzyme
VEKEFFYVNEIYPCLQGEGPHIGKPAVLIRFQSCNLNCRWCDSRYAIPRVNPDTTYAKNNDQSPITAEAVVQTIKAYRIKHLIFTGGEPVLQNFHLILQLLDHTYTAEVESNATLIYHELHPDFTETAYWLYQWNLSPKTANSGQKINHRALQFWSDLGRKHPRIFFKFVVTRENQDNDLTEILQLVQQYGIDQDKVYLMPEGTTVDSQVKNEWLHDICLKHNFHYTPRLHILLFDNRRGV